MNEQKLINALSFLSLDVITPFSKELQITPLICDWRTTGLRNVLTPYLEAKTLHSEFQECCGLASYSLRQNSDKKWSELSRWTLGVYLNGGDDRKPERGWSLILAKGCSLMQEQVPSASQPKLKYMQQKIAEENSRIASLLSEVRLEHLSEWDAMMISQLSIEVEFLKDKISLICTYNKLVREWNSIQPIGFQALKEIFTWGKGIGEQTGMRSVDISFPGAWDYSVFP